MRASCKSALLAPLAALIVTAGALAGCSSEGAGQGPETADGEVGSVGVTLKLSGGVTVDTVAFSISGPQAFVKNGILDVSSSTTISGVIGGIPTGAGYSITLSATSTDGQTNCAGQGTFDVAAHTTAKVKVNLACHQSTHTGSIAVNGVLNICPVIDGLSAMPTDVVVGAPLALSIQAHDSDAGPSTLAYQWTATSGTFDDAALPAPTFTCTAPGTTTLKVSVSDGDPTAGCADTATVDVTCSLPGSGNVKDVLTFAVYGDAPYGTSPTDNSETLLTPAFIANVNADPRVSGVIHVGDIHSGKQYCTQAYDQTIFDLWQAFEDPLVYTPGDNEWTDCHKAAEGGGTYNTSTKQIDYVVDSSQVPVDFAKGEPLANLALVRTLFFPHVGQALGGGSKQVLSQAHYFDPAYPTDAAFVENVMWFDSNVLFVTINLPGGSNNDQDVWYGAPTAGPAQTQEVFERTQADLHWLDAAFAQATSNQAAGMVIAWQADVWDPEKGAAHQTGYEPLVQSLATHTTAFGKPVLMLNGDSHVYQSGNPLSPSDPNASMHPGYDVPNFHRVVVHGSTTPLEWLRLTVDPASNAANGANAFGPFSWERVIQ